MDAAVAEAKLMKKHKKTLITARLLAAKEKSKVPFFKSMSLKYEPASEPLHIYVPL